MIWHDGTKHITWKFVIGEGQNSRNNLARRDLLRLRNLRKKLLTGTHIFQDLNVFPNLTMQRSKLLCFMMERERIMNNGLIPGFIEVIYITWNMGCLEIPKVVPNEAEVPGLEPNEALNTTAKGLLNYVMWRQCPSSTSKVKFQRSEERTMLLRDLSVQRNSRALTTPWQYPEEEIMVDEEITSDSSRFIKTIPPAARRYPQQWAS